MINQSKQNEQINLYGTHFANTSHTRHMCQETLSIIKVEISSLAWPWQLIYGRLYQNVHAGPENPTMTMMLKYLHLIIVCGDVVIYVWEKFSSKATVKKCLCMQCLQKVSGHTSFSYGVAKCRGFPFFGLMHLEAHITETPIPHMGNTWTISLFLYKHGYEDKQCILPGFQPWPVLKVIKLLKPEIYVGFYFQASKLF